MMHHIHIKNINSTQAYLKKLAQTQILSLPTIVTTENQTNGHGRNNRSWEFYHGSIATSFMLQPNPNIPLTSLELGILICDFFPELRLKWPNDFLDKDHKKCGGIISDLIDNILIVGLGLNINFSNNSNHSFITTEIDPINLSINLYEHILNNRIYSSNKIMNRWNNLCLHIDKKVAIDKKSGLFKGINRNGAAILKIEENLIEFYSGSLTIDR